VLIAAKNGAVVGDINHSWNFVPEFGMACSDIIFVKKKLYMKTLLRATGRLPPAAVGCDKMTEKRQTLQMCAMATLNPDAPANQMVQTFALKNSIVWEHGGKGLAKYAADQLQEVMDLESMAVQLVAGGMDGQYFTLHFRQNLQQIMKMKKCFFTHDPAHRWMLADKDVKTGFMVGDNLVDSHPSLSLVISCVSDLLKDVKCGKKYKNIIKASKAYPDEKFYR
jgi:phage gp16-like protein